MRLTQLHGRWVASADTPDGPSLGLGWFPIDALVDALEPFDDLVEELMQTVPEDLRWAEGKIRQDYRAVATADKRGARCPHGHSIPSRAAGGPRCTLGMDCRKPPVAGRPRPSSGPRHAERGSCVLRLIGERPGIRTLNLVIKSHLLCR